MNKNNKLSQCFRVIILILILVTNDAFATDKSKPATKVEDTQISVWVGLNTFHVDRENDTANNENNQIQSVFYQQWFISRFINSYSKRSYLLGYQIWRNRSQHRLLGNSLQLDYGISVAAATGYGRELATNIDGVITLGVSPYVGGKVWLTTNWGLGADVIYIPTDNGGVFVSGATVSYRF